jgi:hypothetical protein
VSARSGSLGDRHASPGMETVGRNGNTYSVCDPAGPYSIDPTTGHVADKRHVSISALVAVAFAPVGGIWAAVAYAAGWQWVPVYFVLGALGGLFLGAIASIPFVGAFWVYDSVANRRHGRRGSLHIDDVGSRAWRLCDIAWQIGRVHSWREGKVDSERRVASIVWSAVQRVVESDREYPDAVRALNHPNLRELAEGKIRRIEQERESLEIVEGNLRKVLDAARSIDAARARAAREREIAKLRLAEEWELRNRLTADERRLLADSDSLNQEADKSAGLVAETEAIAGWLAESDRMLRDI